MRVAVFGATGQVGSLMRKLLEERSFPVSSVRFFASSASAGTKIPFSGEEVVVEDAWEADFSGIDLALMSVGADAALKLAPRLVDAGAIVVDNSRAFRMEPDVPLVVAGVNDEDLSSLPRGIVANPNCTTMVAMPVVKPLHSRYSLREMWAASYQAASGAGREGLRELAEQASYFADKVGLLAFEGWRQDVPPARAFPSQVAFNVIPLAGSLTPGTGETSEEAKLREESRKILRHPGLRVWATCVRVGVPTGHSLALWLVFEQPADAGEVAGILAQSPGVELVDLPTPLRAAGRDEVLVGRVRVDPEDPKRVGLFVSGDNLRKGAALNAVQIAEALVARGLLRAA
jgi:aspartate-semialdehyde dehydrogenase